MRVSIITVPACASCNSGFAGLDEEFRNFVASAENRNASGDRILNQKVLSPNSTSGPAFRNVAGTLSPVVMQMGNLRALNWKLSFPRLKAERFLERIALGMQSELMPAHHGRRHSDILIAHIPPNDQSVRKAIAPLARRLKYGFRGDKVFEFGWCTYPSPMVNYWLFSFYEAQWFLVVQTFDGVRFDHILNAQAP